MCSFPIHAQMVPVFFLFRVRAHCNGPQELWRQGSHESSWPMWDLATKVPTCPTKVLVFLHLGLHHGSRPPNSTFVLLIGLPRYLALVLQPGPLSPRRRMRASVSHPGTQSQYHGLTEFVYTPLNLSSDNIRVLRVLPGSGDALACRLTEVPLLGHHTCLSYTWGSDPADCPILINGKLFRVRLNL